MEQTIAVENDKKECETSGAESELAQSAEATNDGSQTVVSSDRVSSAGSSASNPWRVVADSVTGASHIRAGIVCQDSHEYLLFEPNLLIAAISDGAGSASHAEVGSKTAVRFSIQTLTDFFERGLMPEEDEDWKTLMLSALQAAQRGVEAEAERLGVAPRELASTLILFVASPEFAVVAQIGDGAAVLQNADGEIFALTVPQSGEYLNETLFLVSPRAIEQAQFEVWRGEVANVASFSDGLQLLALKLSDGKPHAPFFTPLFRFLKETEDAEEAKTQLKGFLSSPRITQRADDDLTLLLATRIP